MQGYLTIKEVAEQLEVSEKTIRRRIKEGTLPAELMEGRYGQQYFIPADAVNTAQAITDVVQVKREHDARALSIAIVKALEERDKAMQEELAAMREELTAAREAIEQLKNELQQFQRPWWQFWRR